MDKYEVKKRYSDSVAKGAIDKELVNFVIKKEINDEDLSSTVDTIIYSNSLDDKLAQYDYSDKSISINSNFVDNKNIESDLAISSNYSLLFNDIYKELTYAKQELLFQKLEENLSKRDKNTRLTIPETRDALLADLFALTMGASKRKIKKYGSIYPSEHEANFYGQYKTMKLEDDYNFYSKKTEDYRTLVLTKLLLEGYKYNVFRHVVSPVERIDSSISLDHNTRDMMINIFNNYERMIYGMPVSDKTINSIASISKSGLVVPKCSTFGEVEKRLLKRR